MCRLIPAAIAFAIVAPCVQAQRLDDRIANVRDGAIRLSFATRAGVCGDGEFIGEDTPSGFRTYSIHAGGFSISSYEHVQPACNTGPLRLVVEKSGDRIADLWVAVGVEWRALGTATDLGLVPAAEAARWLIDMAPRLAAEDDVRVAFLAASMADSARIAERMMAIARDRAQAPALRSAATRWLRGPAEREGLVVRADRTLRDVASDATERGELREHALRRIGESRTDANATWLLDFAVERSQPLALRERAVRVLGEELDRPELVRASYPRLDHATLRERAVRVVGERRGQEAAEWLRDLAASGQEHESVRERAIRLLGERGEMGYLRALYPQLDRDGLRERVIRVAAESGRAEALEWLERIVLDGTEQPALRERAVRELADRGTATSDLVRLYDRADELQVRGRLIRIFGERGDRTSLDKLAAIVRDDPNPSLRLDAQRRIAERTR